MKSKEKEIKKHLTETLEKLFELLTLEPAFEVKVTEAKEEWEAEVTIDPKGEAGLLIGRGGETLGSIQFFLGVSLKREIGEWVRVVVNVGDWRERQEEHLVELATQAAEKARQTGEPQPLYNLNSGQRRVIHLALANEKDVKTESEGEGEERYLVVKPK